MNKQNPLMDSLKDTVNTMQMDDNVKGAVLAMVLAYENERTRSHKLECWLIGLVIAMLVVTVGSNIGWMVYESQFEDVYTATQTITQETGADGGTNTFTGDFYGGDYDGKADSNKISH